MMPSEASISQYLHWFAESLMLTHEVTSDDLVKAVCHEDLNSLNVPEIQELPGCYMWRFRPDALIVRKRNPHSEPHLHLLNATSGAVSLKDVGIMNAMLRITGAAVSVIFSPKGVSKEVRLLQGDINTRDRLFSFGESGKILLLSWDNETSRVIQDAIVPIEDRELLRSHRFQ